MTSEPVRAAVEGTTFRSADIAWDIALQTPPTEFYPKFGPLPAVIEVRDQPATWDQVGYTRRLMLSDGGSVIETITDSQRGEFFAYNLSNFEKVLGKLVSGGRAEWTFAAEGTGSRIRWAYAFYPLPGRTLAVRAIVTLFWAPYMRRVLPRIITAIAANRS